MPDHRPGLGRSRGRADQRDHLRRPARHHDAARVPGVQLERGRVHRGDDRLGDDGRRRGHRRQGAARPDGDAPVLRLPHGRLLPALDPDAARLSATPRIFHVNWFRKDADGQVHLAGVRREHAGAEVDHRPRPRAGRGQGDADRLDAALRRHRMARASTSPRRSSSNCKPSTATPGGRKCSGTRSSSSSCTTAYRRKWCMNASS